MAERRPPLERVVEAATLLAAAAWAAAMARAKKAVLKRVREVLAELKQEQRMRPAEGARTAAVAADPEVKLDDLGAKDERGPQR